MYKYTRKKQNENEQKNRNKKSINYLIKMWEKTPPSLQMFGNIILKYVFLFLLLSYFFVRSMRYPTAMGARKHPVF